MNNSWQRKINAQGMGILGNIRFSYFLMVHLVTLFFRLLLSDTMIKESHDICHNDHGQNKKGTAEKLVNNRLTFRKTNWHKSEEQKNGIW
jgi:hypothetical protein